MKKLKIAGIILVLFILYVIIGMLVPFVHMQSVSKTNKSKIHTETFYSTSNENGSDRAKIVSDNQEALDLRLDMIRKAKKGDKDAFCRLIDENVQSMYKVAAAYLKNDEDVADAIQDTILSCYENLKSLKQNRYFKTWMIRILINKCKDMIQKKKLVTYTDQMPETPFHEEKYAAMEWIQALEPLDSKYRLVVLLYYMEGFGIREISDILDMKESTVKSRLYRGRKQIAEMYGYKVKEGRA